MSVSVKIKIKHLTENVPSCTLMTTHNHNIYLTKRFPTTVDHGLGTHSVSHESLTLVFSVLVANWQPKSTSGSSSHSGRFRWWGGGNGGAIASSRLASLVPRPLPDFISQPWRKIGRWPSGRIFFFWTHFRLWMTPHLCIDNIYLQTYDLCMCRTTPSVYLDLGERHVDDDQAKRVPGRLWL